MIKSLLKVFNIVNETQEPPTEWNKMRIKTNHKKGAKSKMKNKRQITNTVSKIFERVLKVRNKEKTKEQMSPMQTGGVENRSTMDNVMIIFAIIERKKYMGMPTYVTFADVQKCMTNCG